MATYDEHNNPGEELSAVEASDQIYTPQPGELQLTIRSVLMGCFVGGIVSCTNIYIGLKIGWTFGASIIAAVLSYAFFSMFGKRLSVLETNVAQTAGSAAGYMSSAAGLVAPIPAMMLLGYEFHWAQLMLWTVSTAFLGVFFAVPLRRQMVVNEKLRFPSGVATAETILAMNSDAGEAVAKARVLLISGIIAGLFSLAAHFVPELQDPPIHTWLPDIKWIGVLATWGFTVYLGPSLLGAGFLIGPRVVLSLLAGAIISWGVLGPWALEKEWAPGPVMSYANGARGWLLWPGVALMVSEALGALLLSWRTFFNAFKMPVVSSIENELHSHDKEMIPNSWWIGGLIVGSIVTTIITTAFFGIAWYLVFIAIALSAVLSIVACRSVGETDINPIGGMGKVTQLVFGGLAPGSMTTNLMTAAITSAGASQSGDMMTDLKTGHLLGASPRKQFIAQMCGIVAGIFFSMPVYYLFIKAYKLGGKELPAPAAMAWKAMAEVLNEGFGALPPFAVQAICIAAVVGFLLACLGRIKAIKPYVPSGLAMGIAFIIPAYYSLVMFYGMVAWLIWLAIAPKQVARYNFALSSGLIAGEGLMGIVNAALTMANIPPH